MTIQFKLDPPVEVMPPPIDSRTEAPRITTGTEPEFRPETHQRPANAQTEVLVGFLRDGRLRVREAILTRIEAGEGGGSVAIVEEFGLSGYGDNPSHAIADLQNQIAALYFSLEGQDRLDSEREALRSAMQAKLYRRTV